MRVPQVIRLQLMSLCHLVDHRAGPKAFRNDLRLDPVRPVPVKLTSSIHLIVFALPFEALGGQR